MAIAFPFTNNARPQSTSYISGALLTSYFAGSLAMRLLCPLSPTLHFLGFRRRGRGADACRPVFRECAFGVRAYDGIRLHAGRFRADLCPDLLRSVPGPHGFGGVPLHVFKRHRRFDRASLGGRAVGIHRLPAPAGPGLLLSAGVVRPDFSL